jgi:glutamate carboxypeptidase
VRQIRLSLLLAVVLVAIPAAVDGQLSDAERRVADYIDQHFEESVALLQRVVEINSGTMNHEGVRRVGNVFRAQLDTIGIQTRWIDFDPAVNRAGHLFGRTTGRGGGRSVIWIPSSRPIIVSEAFSALA